MLTRDHAPRAGLARGLALLLLPLVVGSCGLLPARRSAAPRYATAPAPPRPVYFDQRAGYGGFVAPVRPPPPSRPPPSTSTLLSLAAPSAQGFWGGSFGTAPLPSLPWLPWPGTTGAAGAWPSVPFVTGTPPPRVTRSAARPGCGYVDVGGEQIPVDCFTPGYGEIASAARAIVSDNLLQVSPLHTGAAALPAAVDHREDGSEGPMRHQGRIGACSAFSFAAAIDHALARRTGRPGYVSVMHVWARYHEPSMELPARNNMKRPLTWEDAWPYTPENQATACTWVAKRRCKPHCGAADTCACQADAEQCGRPVDEEALRRADAYPVARVTAVTRITQDKRSLMATLAKGQDIWMAMRFTYEAFDDDKLIPEHDGLRFVLPHFEPGDATSAHAMVIAGYRVQPTGTYFLLHNSWGERWGERGFAWVHEQTLEKNLQAAYVVDAEPWDPSGGKVPPRQETPSQCDGGLLPDSITGQCTPPCPDGSARHNAACPELTDCPAGYVNLFGECVVAAPNVRGTDPATGIRYACAAGGCSYVVPFGVQGCFLPWCSVSCPSPRFRLSSGPFGLSCTE